MDREYYQYCMDACGRCAERCELCVDAWREVSPGDEMADCIALALDCAQFCQMAVTMMQRESHFSAEVCRVCAEICDVCAAQVAENENPACQELAAECQACAEECRRLTMAVIRA